MFSIIKLEQEARGLKSMFSRLFLFIVRISSLEQEERGERSSFVRLLKDTDSCSRWFNLFRGSRLIDFNVHPVIRRALRFLQLEKGCKLIVFRGLYETEKCSKRKRELRGVRFTEVMSIFLSDTLVESSLTDFSMNDPSVN